MADASTSHRIVVTGAAGFIGSALVHHLHALGKDVVALSRSRGPEVPGVSYVTVESYEETQGLVPVLRGADVVVHLAARAHRSGAPAEFQGNARAACAVARACRLAGVRRLVFMSSIGVNGNQTHGRPFTEGDAPTPTEPYAQSKLEGEAAVKEALMGAATTWTILRPPLVYGPDAPGNFRKLVRAVDRGWPLPLGAVRNSRSLLALPSLLELITLCLDHPGAANAVFVAADGEDVSTSQLVRHIAQGLGKRGRMMSVPPSMILAAARLVGRSRLAESLCGSLQIDASHTRRVLGWVPAHSPQTAIAEAVRAGTTK